MKKLFTTTLGALALLAVVAGSTSAAAPHDQPGTPGKANCIGQTNAYLAQAAKNGLTDEAFRGIGGIARGSGLTVAQVQEVVRAYCAQ